MESEHELPPQQSEAILAKHDEAMFLFSQAKYDHAINLLTEILSEAPDYPDAIMSLAMAHYRQASYQEAIRLGHQVESLCPNHPMLHTNLSLFYVKIGNKEKAEHHGLQAKIASWKMGMDTPNDPANEEPSLEVNRPKPTGYRTPEVFPEQPWKKPSN